MDLVKMLSSSLASPPELARSCDQYLSPPLSRQTPIEACNSVPSQAAGDCLRVPSNMKLGIALLSPPPSPFGQLQVGNCSAVAEGNHLPDPPLFPSTDASIPEDVPLFSAVEQFLPLPGPSNVASTAAELPSVENVSEQFMFFIANVWELYRKNPREMLRKEKAFLAKRPQPMINGRVSKVVNSRRSEQSVAQQAVGRARLSSRPIRTPKSTPYEYPADHFSRTQLPTPEPSVHPNSMSPRPARPLASRDDCNFDEIDDYCPPIDSLPVGNNRILKADWKGPPLDLSDDPHRELLHPAEIYLASTLRLSCALYLTSKRRIFQDRVLRARKGMEFRKTDSQKACRIDVNKASKLWTAFDRVGWFHDDWFKHFV